MEVNGYKIEPGANLAGANLIKADMDGADLTGADLTGANLKDVYLNGADPPSKHSFWAYDTYQNR